MKNYNLNYWWQKFGQNYSSFIQLSEYVKNNEALNEHTNSLQITEIGIDDYIQVSINSLSEEAKKFFVTKTVNSIEKSLLIFSNQLIVLFVSIVDSMLEEFMKYMFINSTKSFFNILNTKEYESISKIHLMDVYNSESREELLENHSEIIAKKILTGKMNEVFKRIEKITGYIIPTENKNEIIDLYDLRNKIVHELEQSYVSTEQIKKYHDACDTLRIETGKILKSMNISYDDPIGFEIEKFFKEQRERG